MNISIYNANNELLYDMPSIYEGCIEKCELMKEDSITLKFSLVTPIYFPIGSFAIWRGKKYVVTTIQNPTYNENTGGYDYELKLDAYYYAWKLRIYKYKPESDTLNTRETSFSLTANLEWQVKCLLRCLKIEGFIFNKDTDFTYLIHNIKDDSLDEVKTLSYNSTNYIDALNQIAKEWDTEWWVTDNFVHFGKCQDAEKTNVDFILGKNVVNMTSSKSEGEHATRVYAFGSSRNMPPNWNKGEVDFSVVSVDKENKTFKFDKDIYSDYFEDYEKTKVFDYERIEFSAVRKLIDTKKNKYDFIQIKSNIFELDVNEYKLGDKLYALDNYDNKDRFAIHILCERNDYNQVPTINGAITTIFLFQQENDGKYYKTTIKNQKIDINPTGTYQNALVYIPFDELNITKKQKCYILIDLVFLYSDDYKGEITVSEGTKLCIRTSAEYYKIHSLLANVNANGIESASDSAIFSTKVGEFNFRWEDSETALPKQGDKYRIKNLITNKLPSWWFKANSQDAETIKQMSETHLPLKSPGYIDIETPKNDAEIVEKVLVFDDIYPRTKTTITKVNDKLQNVMSDDGKTPTGEKYTEYYIQTSDFTFNEEWQLQNGENMKIKFQSGALTGLTFETEYNSSETPPEKDNTNVVEHTYFRILRQQFDGGLMLPNGAMYPKVGDEFILTGWDVTRLDEELIKNAQDELATETAKELKKMAIDTNTYECTLFSDIAYGRNIETFIVDENGFHLIDKNGNEITTDNSGKELNPDMTWDFDLGRRITLYNGAFFRSGKRASRVIGYEKKMDIPFDSPIYKVGEKAEYSRLGDLEKQISGTSPTIGTQGLQYLGQTTSGGGSVYLIKRQDKTEASDSNTYSALRAQFEFLSKQKDQNAFGNINFMSGISAKGSNNGTATAADGICEYY